VKRFNEIEIGNRMYPICLSIGATRKITELFGGLQHLESMNYHDSESLDKITSLLEVLIEYGVKAKHRLGEMEYEPISKEDIELFVEMDDLGYILDKINGADRSAKAVDVEVVPDPKFEAAPQKE
jgi:hypothetical protein